MSFFGKLFKFHSSENYEAFLNSLGLPADMVAFMSFKPDQKIDKAGDDSYVLTLLTPAGERQLPFKSGVEVEDEVRGFVVKNTFTVEGNRVTHEVKFDCGLTITGNKKFSASKMVEELTNSNWDGVATVTFIA